jgi:capsular exopolysaccharide synthesis family protein
VSQPLRVIWAARWWLLALVLAAAGTAYYLSDRQTPRYDAQAKAQIVSGQQAQGELLSQEELLNLTNIYSELARTSPVTDLARQKANFQGTPGAFAGQLGVTPEQDLGVLRLTGKSADPKLAARYSNAYADALREVVGRQEGGSREAVLKRARERMTAIDRELSNPNIDDSTQFSLRAEQQTLQSRIADELLRPGDSIRVIQAATAPSQAAAPRPRKSAVAAALAALLLGALLVYLRARITDRYSSADEASLDLQLPILAQIPRGSAQDYASVESLRSLRTRVEFALRDPSAGARNGSGGSVPAKTEGRLLLVTSAEPGAGKTYITSNLARMLAAAGRRVIAVDGDLRRPTLHSAYGIPMRPGLRDVLVSGRGIDPEQLLHSVPASPDGSAGTPGRELRVLPAGSSLDNSSEAISSPRMMRVLESLRADAEFVVTDSPPILAVTDAAILNLYVDGVLIVLDAGRTRRRDARRTVQTLRALDAHVLGIVYNRTDEAEVYPYFYGRERTLVGTGEPTA